MMNAIATSICMIQVVNSINENPSTRCPFCLAGPNDVMVIAIFFRANPDALAQLCLGVLHVGLRGTDHVFKVGFNSPFKTYWCRQVNKAAQAEKKAAIMERFNSLGIFIFMTMT